MVTITSAAKPATSEIELEMNRRAESAVDTALSLSTDVRAPSPGTRTDDQAQGLSRRAVLTFASQILAQGAQLIAGFVFTPIIVHGLGKDLYGAWGMIGSMVGFLGLANLNATAILKLVLGVRQHSPDLAEKRRLIGASIEQWVLLLPLLLLAGGLLVYFSGRVIPVSGGDSLAVRWALTLMVVGVPLGQICSTPSAVLAGQNLNYKAMGLNAGMVLLGGALNAVGIMAGYGIIVLAATSLLGILLLSGARLWVVRRTIPWFGVEWPRRSELSYMVRLSVPGTLGTAAGGLLGSADVLLIGYCFGPSSVAVYLITGALIRYVAYPLQEILRSGNSGIGYLAGKGEWARLSDIRRDLNQTALWGFTVLSAVVLLCNQSFIHRWVGGSFYGGAPLDLAIVLCALFRQLASIDAIPLDATLRLYPKVGMMILWSLVGLGAGLTLTRFTGPWGIPLGMAAGQFGLWGSYQALLRRYTGLRIGRHLRELARPLLATLLGLLVCLLLRLQRPPQLASWCGLGAAAAGISLAVGALYGTLGVSGAVRVSVLRRFLPAPFQAWAR